MRECVYKKEDKEARKEKSPWPPCQTASQRFQHVAVAAAVGVDRSPGSPYSRFRQGAILCCTNCDGQVGDVTVALSSPFVLGGGVDDDDGAHWP